MFAILTNDKFTEIADSASDLGEGMVAIPVADYVKHVAECVKENGHSIDEMAQYYFNCEEAHVDDDGDIFISGPCTPHWIGDEKKSEFLKWLR